ncbi:MAG: PIN domain-containing protein [Candidatus Marinimicrobia bacterium]|nr:PIN domain-containing protein [Candidatus Neomarinimicrobiota bacterium]
MKILVDSSVWIDYFRGGDQSKVLDIYIDENLISTNDLILSEMIPALKLRKQGKLINLLNNVHKRPLNIHWDNIIKYQVTCLKNGINKVGIPDLIITDHVIDNDLILFSLDKHFELISKYIELKLSF